VPRAVDRRVSLDHVAALKLIRPQNPVTHRWPLSSSVDLPDT
jgi:hypothetical protein